MRKTLLMVGALLAMTATLSFASGLELAWNACFGQTGAVATRTSLCTATTGVQNMYASFRPPAGVNKLEGLDVFVDYQVAGGVMPCWWNFAVGEVRNLNLVVLATAGTDGNGDPLVLCGNHYFMNNNASGGGGMINTGPGRGQLKGIAGIAAGSGLPVAADAQQFGLGFRVQNAGTGPSCLGCEQQACFVLNTINLTSAGLPDVVLQSPHPGSENWVTWQGNAAATGCPGATPTRNATWGSVKALYR